jgi:hypothetical protein
VLPPPADAYRTEFGRAVSLSSDAKRLATICPYCTVLPGLIVFEWQ